VLDDEEHGMAGVPLLVLYIAARRYMIEGVSRSRVMW
jgi:ABC-type glycerol-3-phosphate transport system permease component